MSGKPPKHPGKTENKTRHNLKRFGIAGKPNSPLRANSPPRANSHPRVNNPPRVNTPPKQTRKKSKKRSFSPPKALTIHAPNNKGNGNGNGNGSPIHIPSGSFSP